MYTTCKLDKHHPLLDKEPMLRRMFNTNDYVVKGTANYFWVNNKYPGGLIEGLTSEEKNDLFRLESIGLIKHKINKR